LNIDLRIRVGHKQAALTELEFDDDHFYKQVAPTEAGSDLPKCTISSQLCLTYLVGTISSGGANCL
jgi:hypothetical protein